MQLRRRIVHVHNADDVVPTRSWLKQRLYREPMREICFFMADRVVGISNHTLDSFLAGRARRPERDSVHYYGVDSTPFENVCADRLGFRRRWDSRGCVHSPFRGTGGFGKEPGVCGGCARNLRGMDPQAVAVFVGSGSQEQDVLKRARELRVENSVRLLGWRTICPRS